MTNWKLFDSENWVTELQKVPKQSKQQITEICENIVKTLGGCRIRDIKAVYGFDSFDTYTDNDNDVILLKSSKSLCFCKYNKSYVFSKTAIADIDKIHFEKILETNLNNKYYTIMVCENDISFSRYDFVIE